MKPQMPTLPTETRATESPVDIQEQVRRRALELYEQRGREAASRIGVSSAAYESSSRVGRKSEKFGRPSSSPGRPHAREHCRHAPEV